MQNYLLFEGVIYLAKKLTALALILVSICSICLGSCTPAEPSSDQSYIAEEVYVPPLGDIERDVVSLSNIVYARPDVDEILRDAETITAEIDKSTLSYEQICERILSLDKKYKTFSTMLTYMMIKNAKDSSDETTATEYEHLKAAAPALTRAFEELFVSAARSAYAEKLEKEIFWDGFVEKYSDGTIYNDLVVSLLESEAEIESAYASLSTANIKINYGSRTDTYDNIVNDLKSRYRKDSLILKKAIHDCDILYSKALQAEGARSFVELLKVRRRLADALGYKSYSEYAYDILGHGYTEDELNALINDISEYALPVYTALSSKVFAGYFKTHKASAPDKGRVINRVYTALTKISDDLSEAYAYMLNCGLYDIDAEKSNRMNGAFTTYLYDLSSPYIFATLEGDSSDYMTVAHEFGHFYDAYVNFNSDASLDLLEVSSTGLELLVLSSIGDSLSESDYKYLFYSEMKSMLEAMIFQGFYAKFESLAYSLSYDEITEDALNRLVSEAAAQMNLNTAHFGKLEDIIIYHLVMEPFYVQSYCTSVIAALDIFFIECENNGAGHAAYSALVNRQGGSALVEELERVSLPSPFRRDAIMEITDEIYYSIIGSYYFVKGSNNNNAA